MSEALRKRLYEPGFVYVPASSTDVRKRFDAIRQELAKAQPAKPSNVAPLRKAKP